MEVACLCELSNFSLNSSKRLILKSLGSVVAPLSGSR